MQWWCRLHGWLNETLHVHINDLFKTKKAHFIAEFIFYSIYWIGKQFLGLLHWLILKLQPRPPLSKRTSRIIWPWHLHETGHASLIHPGAACIDYHTNRSGRTWKEADESPFFSPSAEIDIRIPHRASARLSCLFQTVVKIVTINVCVWDNRRYAKHHPDTCISWFKHNCNPSCFY